MKITHITSSSNPLLKRIRSLHQRAGRQKSRLFLIEGAKVVAEALTKDLKVLEVVVSQSFLRQGPGITHEADMKAISAVEDKVFDTLATTDGSCGILAIAQMPESQPNRLFAGKSPLVVIAEGIQDPGNLGTMMRTALAAGANGMILTNGCVDPYSPKVVRSASGALFALPLLFDVEVEDAVELVHQNGLKVVACDPEADLPFWSQDLTGPIALVFGNEGQGISAELPELADKTVSIPMAAGCESLNVAISAGIILFGARQQRMSVDIQPGN